MVYFFFQAERILLRALSESVHVCPFPGVVGSQNQSSGNVSEQQPESAKWNGLPSFSISVLQEIGRRCNSKVSEISTLIFLLVFFP